MSAADPRFARLPIWAQQRIETLERDVARLEAELAAGPDDSDTFVQPYTRDRTPLGSRPLIEFHVGGEVVSAQIMGDGPDGRHLSVTARNGHLEVVPQSSNVLRVRASGDFTRY